MPSKAANARIAMTTQAQCHGSMRDGVSSSSSCRSWFTAAIILLCAAVQGLAQTVTITSPADGATIQAVNLTNGRELAIPFTFTEGSGAHTEQVCGTMNDRPINPENCSYLKAGFPAIKAYPGLYGDGDQVYQLKSYDVFGNVLATSATATIHARLSGMPSSMTVSGTSGAVNVTVTEYNGTNLGGACNGALYADGRLMANGTDYASAACNSTGITFTGLDTTRFRNGNRELRVDLMDHFNSFGGDPVVVTNTFTFAGTPSTLTVATPNDLVTNRPVAATSSGALPSPLIAAAVWGSVTSTSNPTKLVVSDICTVGSCVVTLNASPGVTPGSGLVDIRNVVLNNAQHRECEGLFTASAASGNTFTYIGPSTCDGTVLAGRALTVVTNPVYAIWLSPTTIQLAAAPNGAALTLSGGSGTLTLTSRVSNGYWVTDVGNDGIEGGGLPLSFARQVVDFENGHTAMEIRPPAWQYERVTGFVGDTVCPIIVYTDLLTPTAATCTTGTYTVVPDGGFTNVVTVAANGAITYLNPGWAKITVAYPGFQTVTVYVHAYSSAVTFNHFTHDGHIATAYTPGQSFIPTSWWFLNCLLATLFRAAASRQSSWTQLMFDSGINTCFTGGFVAAFTDPASSSFGCPSMPDQGNTWIRQWADDWKTKYGTPVSFELDTSPFTFGTNGPINMYAFANNVGFDRQTCIKNAVANIKADGRTYRFFGFDELNAAVAGAFPNASAAVGGANFINIVVAGGAGAATANVHTTFGEAVWNQATGIGGAVNFSGATNTCLNGWKYITGSTPDTTNYGASAVSALTFSTSCANGTYDATTDPGLKFNYFPETQISDHTTSVPGHACTLPKYVGTSPNLVFQGWSNVYTVALAGSVADASMTSIVVTGSGTTTYTIHVTGHQWAEGWTLWISGATNTALNGMYIIHVVDANTVTTTGTAAAGTYNSGTDPNLLIGYDCNIPANYMSLLYSTFRTGADIAFVNPIIGGSYSFPKGVGNWNDPAVTNAGLLYHAQSEEPIYGDSGGTYLSQFASQQSGLTTRAYQVQARGDLVGTHGMQYQRNHVGYLFDPAQDNPGPYGLFWDANTQTSNQMSSLTWGVSSFRYAWFQANNAGQFALPVGTIGGGAAFGPENATAWKGAAHGFQHLGHMTQYYLQPHCNSPYLGPMFNTLCTTSATYGNSLTIVYLGDGGTTYPMTVDLSAIRLAGGSLYNSSLTGYREIYTALAGNPTTDAHTFLPGETVTYIAQPSGAASDLTSTTFPPPATLPYGATHYAIRYGYYPRDLNDDPVAACDAGCTVGLHRVGGSVWYQNLYLDANYLPLAMGDAQMISGN